MMVKWSRVSRPLDLLRIWQKTYNTGFEIEQELLKNRRGLKRDNERTSTRRFENGNDVFSPLSRTPKIGIQIRQIPYLKEGN